MLFLLLRAIHGRAKPKSSHAVQTTASEQAVAENKLMLQLQHEIALRSSTMERC